ncbi:hypothetical protein [Salinigranum sp. GCM10025319]|uniref:hypothetical protein n=1 Tax=Salinigranum sp. GCM10025319 TaxID=3252687 RepID=UPI00360DAA79
MTQQIHPTDHSVAELKEELEAIDDVERLESLLDAERNGDDRVTAIEAIEERLESLGVDEDETDDSTDDSDASTDEDVEAGDDPDAEAETADEDPETGDGPELGTEADESDAEADAEAQTGSDEADTGDADEQSPVEESWSKNTTVRSDRETEQTERPSREAPRGTDDATLDSVNVSAKRAEALSTAGSRTEEEADKQSRDARDRDRDRVRFALDDVGGGGRMEARIRQLQTEVGDLKAYTNALEEFLDEEGTGQQVIESIRDDIATLEDEIAALTDDVGVHGRTLGQLWGVIGDVENALSDLEETISRQRRDIDDVGAELQGVRTDLRGVSETADERYEEQTARFEGVDETLAEHAGALDEVDDEIGSVGERVDAVADDVRELGAEVDERFAEGSDERAELADRIEANAEAIEELGATVDDLADTVETLDGRLGESGHVDQRFETVEEEIQALQEWREQLSSVLMGSAGGQPNATEQ